MGGAYPGVTFSQLAPFVLLGLSVLFLLTARARWALTLLALAVLAAVATGTLRLGAVAVLLTLWGACWLYMASHKWATIGWRRIARVAALLGIVALSLALGLHVVGGVRNLQIVNSVVLHEGAAPYSLWLNFDKTAAGILVFAVCYLPLRRQAHDLLTDLKLALLPFLITALVLMVLSVCAGYVRWDPRWNAFFWPWVSINFLFICMSEEAFFRGFVQLQLAQALGSRRHGPGLAIAVSAALFGLAHFAGGWIYAGLAGIAGVGYGIVFQRTQRLELSMLAHCATNAVQFLLFTYPSLR
jgi:membrane protease YdiL (CAAX protease family)